MGQVGVGIVTFNSRDHIQRLIEGLLIADGHDIAVRIVDNGSTDGTKEWVSDWLSAQANGDLDCSGVAFGENRGFTAGVNSILRYFLANYDDMDYIALLNPDIVLCDGWLIHQLPIFTYQPRCGIIGCRQVNGNEIVHAGGVIHRDPRPLYEPVEKEISPGIWVESMEMVAYSRFGHRRGHLAKDSWNVIEPVPWVTFAAALLRREMVEEIGLLDERFFNYASDAHYCCKAWQHGWEVWYTGKVTVYHHVGASEETGGREVKERKIADLRLFAKEEQSHASHWAGCSVV